MQFAFHKSARGAAYSRYESGHKQVYRASGKLRAGLRPRPAAREAAPRGAVQYSSQPSLAAAEPRIVARSIPYRKTDRDLQRECPKNL